MQETFEHNISQQLDDFKLQPSPIVWQEVDAALHPERKRRFIIWWWLSAAIIGISAIGYWLIINQTSTIASKEIANNQMTTNKAVSTTKNALLSETKKENKKPFTIEKEIVITTEKRQKAMLGKPNITIPIYQQTTNNYNNRTAKKELIVNNSLQAESTNNVIVNSDSKNVNNQPNTVFEKRSNSNVTITKSSQNTDTSKSNKVNKKLSKKSHWLVIIGGGILETTLTQKTNSTNISSSPSVGNGGFTGASNNNTQPTITSPKTGFNVQLGLAYNTELNKHWQLQTGLQYQYLTNQHGLKADTTTGFTNSFIADNNHIITNKAHLLQMPITFAYNLQPSSKHQLHVLMGGSLAYVVSEKWLISNASTGRFYYNTSVNNRWLFGVHGGLSYTLTQKLNLAAIAAYTISPIQSQVDDKNHFVQYNIQLSTPISFSNKKKSKK